MIAGRNASGEQPPDVAESLLHATIATSAANPQIPMTGDRIASLDARV